MEIFRILLVDDEPDNLALLYRTLRGKYDLLKTTSPLEALKILEKEKVDIVISDHKMPEMDGVEFLRRVYEKRPETMRLLVTAYSDSEILIRAINYAKIYRYIKKPYEPNELLLTVSNTTDYLRLKRDNENLVNDLKELFAGTVKAIVEAMDSKDSFRSGRSKRVTYYATEIAQKMNLPVALRDKIELAGMLHDIGMISVSDNTINKTGALTPAEIKEIQNHVAQGVKILSEIKQLKDVVEIIKYHHEFYNGNGYPTGLKAENIPIGSRIIAVADAFDAMVSERSYRRARTPEEALKILRELRGIQFDPKAVDVFTDLLTRENTNEVKKS